mmetsp:Transcript_14526/g.23905  ORF Transcript_14526/g.23905 Transcript_14526/m.23905 type:complete len:323 (+) Transcript_14526:2448-3416(+)
MLMGGNSCGCFLMRCPTAGCKTCASMGNLKRHHFWRTAATRTRTRVPRVSASRTSGQSSSEMGMSTSVSHPQSTSAPWYSSSATTSPSSSSPSTKRCSCLRVTSPMCLTASRDMPWPSTSCATTRESRSCGRSSFHISRGRCSSLLTPTYVSAPPSTADTISWSGSTFQPPYDNHWVASSSASGGPSFFAMDQVPDLEKVYGLMRKGISAEPSCGMRATASSSRPSSVSTFAAAAAASAAITCGRSVMVMYTGSLRVSFSCCSYVSRPSGRQGASVTTGSSSRPMKKPGFFSPSAIPNSSNLSFLAWVSRSYRDLSTRDSAW